MTRADQSLMAFGVAMFIGWLCTLGLARCVVDEPQPIEVRQ